MVTERLEIPCPVCDEMIKVLKVRNTYVTVEDCLNCGSSESYIEKLLNTKMTKLYTVEKGYISKDLKKGGV